MTSGHQIADEIFAAGYAIRAYNINNDVFSWRIGRNERVIDLPAGAVPLHDYPNYRIKVARVVDVLKAADGRGGE